LVENPEQKRLLANLGVNGMIILKWVLNIQGKRIWTRLAWLRGYEPESGFREHGN
jgi:hypothetical protein